MTFHASQYANFIATDGPARERLFLQYMGPRNDFDIVIIGSGIGGGVLADDLAERLGGSKRILVIEAGSFIYPTHVYNLCRFSNSAVGNHFGCDVFWQYGNDTAQHFIGGKPMLNFGGRSIFWSGLIPTIQGWELDFFPPNVRQALQGGLLDTAGEKMNESRSMGTAAQAIVSRLRQSSLAQDFSIHETPRALHQPYLMPDGTPKDRFFTEPTGVFNTAELLLNQAGLTPGVKHGDGPGMHLMLNHYVEDVQHHGTHYEIVCRNTLTNSIRVFHAGTVVLAAGSIESPKLLRRSSMYPWLADHVKQLVGRGLTDHPTSNETTAYVTDIGNVPIPKDTHAKIIFYSRGLPDPLRPGETRYPFNVEMNINHEYWHLRESDPDESQPGFSTNNPVGSSRVDIKFSFGNCLDDANEVKAAPPYGYVPEISFGNLRWMDRLRDSRFPALAGWQKSYEQIFEVLNSVTHRIFSEFRNNGAPARPEFELWYGQNGKGFGYGTVHHAAGSLRMPYKTSHGSGFSFDSVVDEDLRLQGHRHFYVCDMSVMPFSSAANPVRTLAALALRLSRHFG
jgi:choline dehydrogenase-like flavoprotein